MLRLILLLPVLVLLVLFGLSNREEVLLHLWPFDLAWAVPLSTAMLVFAAVFFLFGALVAWVAGLPARARARRAERAAQVLEAELNEHRAAAARQVGPVPQRAGTSLVISQRPAA
ncbi:lipopolysaccharide assembly protein LapA domain-containing protein [Belnapia sp. F-4-1]|uniref:lipopolysaccharide assembly protein LapA domain-containing protein n=1 Tax=Belnapia sp. F-4-1 TaxID=1545443 RepID=UPI0005BA43AC|nr:lipopolysaccharide assembly protein LapA domain-containing protein [Belnapia sp. F-4-1]